MEPPIICLKKKTCRVCGFVGNEDLFSKNQNRCKKCTAEYRKKRRQENPEIERDQHKKWREQNPDYDKNYRNNNPEKEKAKQKRWREKNPEYQRTYRDKHPENGKKYYENNKENERERGKKLKEEHPEKIAEYNRKYQKTPKGKKSTQIQNAKRRKLGHDPINKWFKGAEAHHLRYSKNPEEQDNDITLYVPRKLHRSIWHNGNTGQGMREINIICLEWYFENTPIEERDPKAAKLYLNYCMLPEPKWNPTICPEVSL